MNTSFAEMVTPEQRIYAHVFMSDLLKNQQISGLWLGCLEQIRSSRSNYQEKLYYLDRCLLCLGYETTATAVLDLLKQNPWNDVAVSEQSKTIVEDLLNNL